MGKEFDRWLAIILTWVQAKRWGLGRGGVASPTKRNTDIGLSDICSFEQYQNSDILFLSLTWYTRYGIKLKNKEGGEYA